MNIKQSAKLFLGSLLVYVAMASCVASEKAVTLASTSSGGGGTAGASGSGGVGGVGGVMDPVPDASAEPIAEPFFKSGTRLKLQYLTGEDGSRLLVAQAFYDSSLQAYCLLQEAPDGVVRCMPGTKSEPWSQYVAFQRTHE